MKFDRPLPDTFEELTQIIEHPPGGRADWRWIFAWTARWNARQVELANAKQAFDAGNKSAALKAVSVCFEHDLAVPTWASDALVAVQKAIDEYQARSWDEVLGRPHPKGKHLAAQRKRMRLRAKIHWAVLEAVGDHARPIDECLFEEIGSRFSVGKTLAAELYYEEQHLIDEF